MLRQQDSDRKSLEIDAAWAVHRPETAPNPRRPWLERHLASQGWRCAYCNIGLKLADPLDPLIGTRATIDHVVPRARGGPDVEENTVAACHDCNNRKADMSLARFLDDPFRLERLADVTTPPDRLAVDPSSPFYCAEVLERGVRVVFRGRVRTDVHEYCKSDRWVLVPAGKAVDRTGRPVTLRLRGNVSVSYGQGLPPPLGERLRLSPR